MILLLFLLIDLEPVPAKNPLEFRVEKNGNGYWLRDRMHLWHWDRTKKVVFSTFSHEGARPISFILFKGRYIVGWAKGKSFWVTTHGKDGKELDRVNDFFADYFFNIHGVLHTSPDRKYLHEPALVPIPNWEAKPGYFKRPLLDYNFREVWVALHGSKVLAVSQLEASIHIFQDGNELQSEKLKLTDFIPWQTPIKVDPNDIDGSALKWFKSFSRVVGFDKVKKGFVFAYEPGGNNTHTKVLRLNEQLDIISTTQYKGWTLEGYFWGGTDGEHVYVFDTQSFKVIPLEWPD